MAYQKFLKINAIKQTSSILLLTVCLILSFFISESFAWLIFHKPEYKGIVVDAETQEPLEGVVVVAVYYVTDIIGGPGGLNTLAKNWKEVLTDKKGNFLIPSYTTMMGPNSTESYTEFIIYKPGYASYPNYQSVIVPFNFCGPEYLFTKEVGLTGIIGKKSKSVSITYGIAELPKLNTRKERLKAVPGTPIDTTTKELPLLFKAINTEYKNFGLEPVGRPSK